MNFISIMAVNGRPTREVEFFDTREQALAYCTAQNGFLAHQTEAHYIVRALKDVF